jgi:hypothetical protein
MRNRRHQILALVLIVCCIPLLSNGCKTKEQPAETGTLGNATDRNPATGTNGTGEPVSPAVGTATAAQQLGTVATTSASGTAPVLTGTEEVHAQKSDTTSTLQGPGGTTTASVAAPTDTTATITTTTKTTKKH